jgi:outer membrane immunogenic protein
MKKLGIVLAGWVAMSTLPATAADMAVKAAPYIEPAYSWTGFYLGINSGFSRGETRWQYANFDTRADQVTFGGLVGGTVGYNWQFGSWVAGVEGDFDWANIRGEVSCPNPFFRCSTRLDSIATFRGRLGYTVKNLMFFVTGGGAWGATELRSDHILDARVPDVITDRQWKGGYSVGAGLEWAPWGPNWSYKFEWLYYDLGSSRYNVDLGNLPVNDIHARQQGHIWRTGINYHFNLGGPVRASY